MKKYLNLYLIIGSLLLASLFSLALYGFFFHSNYESIDLMAIDSPPSPTHFLGTDALGRDVWTNLLYGLSVSSFVGILATLIPLTIGVSLGILAGYFGGSVDFAIMRLVDILMCLPLFILASAMAAVLGPGLKNLILIISCLSWTDICRIIRADIIELQHEDFILASRVAGFSRFELTRYHFLPHILPKIAVSSTLSMATAILMEASLSFLGLGVRMPMPSLGNMLASAQSIRSLEREWWTWLPAGIMIVALVLAINCISEGLTKTEGR